MPLVKSTGQKGLAAPKPTTLSSVLKKILTIWEEFCPFGGHEIVNVTGILQFGLNLIFDHYRLKLGLLQTEEFSNLINLKNNIKVSRSVALLKQQKCTLKCLENLILLVKETTFTNPSADLFSFPSGKS